MSTSVSNKALGIKEASEFLGCGEWKLRQLVKENKIPYYRIGNRIKFSEQALEKWINSEMKRNYKYS